MTFKFKLTPNTRWSDELAYPLTAAEEASVLMPELLTVTENKVPVLVEISKLLPQTDQLAPIGINPSSILNGSSGNDTLHGTAADDTLDGGAGYDNLYGYAGHDNLIGGDDGDVLDGGTGSDTMIGGMGNDWYYVDDAGDVVIENASSGTDNVISSISYTLSDYVDHLTLTGSAAINGTGNLHNNWIQGNSAANILDGGDGLDQLEGGAGDDTMIGGLGNDYYVVRDVGDVVIEHANEGTDRVNSSFSYTLGSNVEELDLSGTAEINGTGNSLNNRIQGNAAANVLDGGAGADTMYGGLGDDSYVVDDVGDWVSENANSGTDKVYTTISYTLGSNVEHLTLIGTSAINGTGNTLNNTITGNARSNTLDGGAGADTMAGGEGHDKYRINDAGDTVSEAANQGTDTVQSSISYTLGDNLERLALIGNGANSGTGNALDNYITGNVKANALNGAEGNDTLRGGGGADQFVFNTALNASNADTITDFSRAQGDTIVLDDVVFAQLAGATNVVNHFRLSSQAAMGGDDYIVYKKTTGELFYDASGNGTGTLELFAVLSNLPQNLTGSQFAVI